MTRASEPPYRARRRIPLPDEHQRAQAFRGRPRVLPVWCSGCGCERFATYSAFDADRLTRCFICSTCDSWIDTPLPLEQWELQVIFGSPINVWYRRSRPSAFASGLDLD